MKPPSELTQIELDHPATPQHQRASRNLQQAPPIQQVQPIFQTPPINQLTAPSNPHDAPPNHQPPFVAVSCEPPFSAQNVMSSSNTQQPRYNIPHYSVAPNQLQQQQLQQQQVCLMQQPYQVTTSAPIGTQQYQANQSAGILYSPVIPEALRYQAKSAKTLGILQIITAVMFVVFGVIAIVMGQWVAWICIPIWTAFFLYLPAGILGVISAKPTSMQSYVISSCMFLSCLAAIAAVGTAIVMIISGFNDFYLIPGNVVMDTLIALLALGEMILAIMQTSYCCRAPNKCCGTKGQYAPQVYHTNPCNQTMTPVARYPAEVMQQQRRNYHVQSTVQLAQWTMRSPNSGEQNQDFLTNPNGNADDLIQPPKYTDAPPAYSSSVANM